MLSAFLVSVILFAFVIELFIYNGKALDSSKYSEQYAAENGEKKIGLIASGGLAEAILPCCRNKFQYVADLTLQGAVSLYLKNGPAKRL